MNNKPSLSPHPTNPIHDVTLSKIHFNILSYLLTVVGYMTLTLSLPLSPHLPKLLGTTQITVQSGIGLIFFLFSVSAITISTLSDVIGAHRALKIAQILSIFGLLTLGSAISKNSFFIGCILVGLGTGCYVSIARSILSRHASSITAMRKAFSNLSLFIVIAPILSSYLARYLLLFNWRWAYYVMAIIEILLFCYAYFILKFDAKLHVLTPLKKLLSGFVFCFSKPLFVINLLSLGFTFAIFMQLIMANLFTIFVKNERMAADTFNLVLVGISASYIVGILTYRNFITISHHPKIRFVALFLFFIGLVSFTFFTRQHFTQVLSIYILCFSSGFLVPLTTGAGMSLITQGQGAAAALFTASFAIISSFWSFLSAHLALSTRTFFVMGNWISLFILLLLSTIYFLVQKQERAA